MGNSTPFSFVFPGQGSQSVGMQDELADDFSIVRETYAEASEPLGYDLWALVHDGPDRELNKTARTQPALLTAGVAAWRCWQGAGGGRPAVLAGHSLGEYTALVCAGVLAFADAVRLVAERGRLMQAAVAEGEGRMAAILGLDDGQVESICREAADAGIVSVANYNSPGQVVIAGQAGAVDRAVELAREAGARRALTLPVSVPSHCALMEEAAGKFAGTIATVGFSDAGIPVVQNVDAAERVDSGAIKESLLAQLYQPVRWVDSIRHMRGNGIGVIIESGPGQVLAGLVKRIDRDLKVFSIRNRDTLNTALQASSS